MHIATNRMDTTDQMGKDNIHFFYIRMLFLYQL